MAGGPAVGQRDQGLGVGVEGGAVGEEGGGVAVRPHPQHHEVQLHVGHRVTQAVRVLPVTWRAEGGRGGGGQGGQTVGVTRVGFFIFFIFFYCINFTYLFVVCLFIN